MTNFKKVTKLNLTYPSLPSVWDGLRIAFIADLHFQERVTPLDREVMQILEAEQPDILIMGGDSVNHYKDWKRAVDWFRQMPATLAKIAVPGNWEYKYDNSIGCYRYYMQKAGFSPLCNSSVCLERDGSSLSVIGFDDVRKGFIDIARAYEDVAADSFILGVCHSPDILIHLDSERFKLLLCGHTHGGQVRIPGYGAIVTSTKLGKKFDFSWGRYGRLQMAYFLSPGSGADHVMLRC